ncbi:MAG TPA: pitrilysin family protein [Vicinamibacterales bacterium]|nr:pitrilysin family protein [Vicinamibacterales bacterium]
MRVPFEKRTLPNGLDVIVHEDHRVPLVAVSVWYHVGSKNERPGKTGFAHLFEHLMFEGSEHHRRSYFEPLQHAGGTLNGSTSTDRTDYWEVVPTEAARLALWMEADRMGWLLPALTPDNFETQRGVVINERRQNYENKPYGLAQFTLARALYPEGHPYSWPTIGEIDDLQAASIDDVRGFFARYYHPANASLVIAGDLATTKAFEMAEELFGGIPAGPRVEAVSAPPVESRAQTVFMNDRVDLARIYLAWPTPPLFADGDAELDLAADLLANGRTSRLYRRLVHDRRVATELAASQSSRELVSTFQIVATAAPGQSLATLRTAIDEEIDRLRQSGPDDSELARGRAQAEAAFIYRVQSLGGTGGRADQLNAYNVYQGRPDGFDADLSRYLNATPERLRDTVARWIAPERATVLSVLPMGHAADSAGL